MTTSEYNHVSLQREVDGGYSGALTVTAAEGDEGTPMFVFVDSESMGNLMLAPEQAVELATALTRCSGRRDASRKLGSRRVRVRLWVSPACETHANGCGPEAARQGRI